MTDEGIPLKISLREYGECAVSTDRVMRAAGARFTQLPELLDPLVEVRHAWDDGHLTIRSTRYVGTLKFGGMRVDVRPRMTAGDLVQLIRYALGSTINSTRRSAVGGDRIGLDELICRLLADELTRIRQFGLSRKYVGRSERLPTLRGRADFAANFPWNERGMTSIHCRFHELTCDNLDNRLVRAALERATLLDTTVATRQSLLEHRQVWASLAQVREVSRADFKQVRNQYTRLSEHYRLTHHLCEVIALGRSAGGLFVPAPHATGGLVLDMARLFELFVQRLFEQVLRPMGMRVTSQAADSRALLDRESRLYKRVRPDLIIYMDDDPIAVVDAKYKEYWRAEPVNGKPERMVSNADLYQLFFYAQRLQMRYKLSRPPVTAIACPLPPQEERAGSSVIGSRYTQIRWHAGPEVPNRLELLLLPVSQILASLAAGRYDIAAIGDVLQPVTWGFRGAMQ